MSSELTKQDLDLLFEAVEAWEREEIGPPMGARLMAALTRKGQPGIADEMQKQIAEESREADVEKRQRKERGVLLRAKLLTLRDRFEASQFVDSLGRTADDEA